MRQILATLMAVIFCAAPVAAGAPGGMSGQVVGVDGRPAAGFQVVLVTAEGEAAGSAATDSRGDYRFEQVPSGEYGIGIVSPAGEAVPVLAAPTEVPAGEQVVRNIRLMEAGGLPVQLAPAKGGLGVWWAGLSPGAKVWTVLGSLVGIGLIYDAADDDDDREMSETPVNPG